MDQGCDTTVLTFDNKSNDFKGRIKHSPKA